jgi:hypothetical protein
MAIQRCKHYCVTRSMNCVTATDHCGAASAQSCGSELCYTTSTLNSFTSCDYSDICRRKQCEKLPVMKLPASVALYAMCDLRKHANTGARYYNHCTESLSLDIKLAVYSLDQTSSAGLKSSAMI